MEGPHDKRRGERTAIGLLIRLSYGTVDEFVERFASNISRGGVFIRTREPRAVGTLLSFEMRLQGGEAVVKGRGVVRWIQPAVPVTHPPAPPGMGVQFLELDAASRELVGRMVARKERRGLAPGAAATAPPSPSPLGRGKEAGEPGAASEQGAGEPGVATGHGPGQSSRAPPSPAPRGRGQGEGEPTGASEQGAREPTGASEQGAREPTGASEQGAREPGGAAGQEARRASRATPSPPPRGRGQGEGEPTGASAQGESARDAAPPMPAQADLSQPHRIEQLTAGAPRVDVGLPAEPAPIARPSRAIIGIDLGTTNSCAAVVKDGRPYVIPSREGHNTVPSVVALNARRRIVVGHLARAQLLTDPSATVYGAKRLIGRAYESDVVQEIRSKFAYEIVPDAAGLAAVRLGPETLSLEQVSALILREVKEVAQNHLGEEVNRAVITVPAYYNERQRAAVRTAGQLAGLHVERILNEPTAAALAYAYGRHLEQRVLVYDLGGGTFDASVLELNDNVYEVVSTGGDTFLGGVDFDNRLVDHLLQRWAERTGTELSGERVALSRLVDAAERAKCALSERTEFPIQLPFLALRDGRPVSLDAQLTRAEVVRLVEPLVDRTLEVCREVLLARGLGPGDIDEVLLVGGQSRMPLVHEKVAAFFGRQPSRSVHPDEAVAIGAALLAQSLGSAEGVVLIDVLPMSIGIGLPGGRVKTIIERNTALPARKQYGLATSRDGQTEFELVVLQGESEVAAECEYLGTLKLTGLPPGPRGMVKIAVTFELGAECLLTVTARELNTGRKVQAVMSAKEGPNAAHRKLEQAGAEGRPPAGAPPDPAPPHAPAAAAPDVAAAPKGGFAGLVRRLLGKTDEAR